MAAEDNIPSSQTCQAWDPGPGPFKSFQELYESGELTRPKTAEEELLDVLDEVAVGELPVYRLGRQYAVCLLTALIYAHLDSDQGVEEAMKVADHVLQPLSEVDDSELLRDFIAGLAKEMETTVQNMLPELE